MKINTVFWLVVFSNIVSESAGNTHAHRRTPNTDELVHAGSAFKISQHQAKGFSAHAGVCIVCVRERENGRRIGG